jgi:hypothetical protein
MDIALQQCFNGGLNRLTVCGRGTFKFITLMHMRHQTGQYPYKHIMDGDGMSGGD